MFGVAWAALVNCLSLPQSSRDIRAPVNRCGSVTSGGEFGSLVSASLYHLIILSMYEWNPDLSLVFGQYPMVGLWMTAWMPPITLRSGASPCSCQWSR